MTQIAILEIEFLAAINVAQQASRHHCSLRNAGAQQICQIELPEEHATIKLQHIEHFTEKIYSMYVYCF